MKKYITLILIFLVTNLFSQRVLRDSIMIRTDIFQLVYSEVLQQPKCVRYRVQCHAGKASRRGMDFYICDSIKTSDDKDYENNPYDKGDGFWKTITYGKSVEKYYFKNEKPASYDYNFFRIR